MAALPEFIKKILKLIDEDKLEDTIKMINEKQPTQRMSFTKQELEEHCFVTKYGDFYLTEAVRPPPDLSFVPIEGYQIGTDSLDRPALMISVSAEKLWDVFLDLFIFFPDKVDVKIQHHKEITKGNPILSVREEIDKCVLKSNMHEFKDVLLGNGFVNIGITSEDVMKDLVLCDHKIIGLYGDFSYNEVKSLLNYHSIKYNQGMKTLLEYPCIFRATPNLQEKKDNLLIALGMIEEKDEDEDNDIDMDFFFSTEQ